MRTGTRRRWWVPMVTILLPLWLVGATAGLGQATPPALTSPAGAPASAQAPLLQFRSQGHVLGFTPDRMYTVGMGGALIEEFVGAHPVQPQAAATAQPADTKGAPPLQAVTYPHLWDGITLSYTTSPAGLAMSTYRVEPKADPRRIRLRYNTEVAIQPDGSLRVQHPTVKGYFTLSAPKAWQEIGGRRVPVSVAFTQHATRVVGFTVGRYDPTAPLLIDPTYSWHTFYGSASHDGGYGIAVDGSGNLYVTGLSGATWNGPAGEAPLHAHSGYYDLVVLKLTSAGAYQWHTFYGAAGSDEGRGITVDGSGTVYVTGESAATWGTPLNPHSGSYDIVVLKLDSAGAYQWHTFYGAAGSDEGRGITVDGSGTVYVIGYSGAGWTGPAGEAPLHAHSGGGEYDLVVLKLTSAGAYQWHTFYGAEASEDYGYGIAVDGSGNVYITGYSGAGWTGPGGEAPLHAHSGYYDLVVLKLTSAGAYQWHTFYGSGGYDYGLGIAVDGSGNVYVTGASQSTWGTPLHAHSGSADLVVLKLTSAGAYQWHTFYGSASDDKGYGIAVNGSGNVYVTGYSAATWNGPGGEAPLHAHSGSWDLVVLKLTSAGAYQWHTFYGSASTDGGRGIAVNGSGNVYVTGYSDGGWNGPGGEAPLHAHSGGLDLVVLKLAGDAAPSPIPDIKANGSDGPLTIPFGTDLIVTVTLDPGGYTGTSADWWVAATSPFGLYWYTLNQGWVRSDTPIRTYGGPLFTLAPYEVLHATSLPIGIYTLYFGVDLLMNGALDFGQLHVDSVEVQIQ